MAVVVGTWWALSFRLLGYFETVPMMIADQAMRVCRWGFLVSLASGIALFLSQPIRDLVTTDFDVKMVMVIGALLGMATVRHWLDWARVGTTIAHSTRSDDVVLPGKARVAVLLTNFFWLGAIVSGRLIGYLEPPPIS